jgi:hypothetical protein
MIENQKTFRKNIFLKHKINSSMGDIRFFVNELIKKAHLHFLAKNNENTIF